MVKILLVTYYGIREALKSAADALMRLGYKVDDYPIVRYSSDPYDKRSDFLEHFDGCIGESDPEVILFWTLSLSFQQLSFLKNRHAHRIFAFYNWDDPHYWTISSNEIEKKSILLDLVFSSCEESTTWYMDAGTKRAIFCPPGFDPDIHRPISDRRYECDVSICCTNFYDREERQIIPRRWLIEQIAKESDIQLHIYGPEDFKQQYPKNYRGWVRYEDTAKVYHNSRINICTHVIGDCFKYVNERAMLITGSGGLLYVDGTNGIDELFKPDRECILIDKKDPVKQIRTILADRKKYDTIAEEGKKNALTHFTYDHWAKVIDQEIKKILDDVSRIKIV